MLLYNNVARHFMRFFVWKYFLFNRASEGLLYYTLTHLPLLLVIVWRDMLLSSAFAGLDQGERCAITRLDSIVADLTTSPHY